MGRTQQLGHWRGRIRSTPGLASAWRIVVLVVGLSLIGVGLALIVLPGPWTIPLVVLGLAILASEFVWAERLLHRAKGAARSAQERSRRRR